MKKNRKIIISLVISFVLLVSFILIVFSRSNILNKLSGSISSIEYSNLDINIKKEYNKITIENGTTDMEYQIINSDYNTVNRIKLIIRDRDYYIDGYKKLLNSNNGNIDGFNRRINEIKFETNKDIQEVLKDVTISDENWQVLTNNEITIEEDNIDKIILIRTGDDYLIDYLIKSRDDINIANCDLNEEYLKYAALTSEEKEEYGKIPSVCVEEPSKDPELADDGTTYPAKYPELADDGTTYPAKYPANFGTDEYFNTTPEIMKNQMTTPFCVVFAQMASLESCLYKKYNQVFNLSERYSGYKVTKPFLDSTNPIGNRLALDDGFNDMEMAKSLAFYGPVYQNEMPYINSYEAIKKSEIESKYPVVDVNDIEYKKYSSGSCDNNRIEYIKNLITTYGDVELGMYYNKENLYNGSYYYNGYDSTNHAVAIIGWDDNYSKNNFNPDNRPSSDGAFIIKNSYGKETANSINGYFYLSYEDSNGCKEITSVQDADFDFSDNKIFYDYGGTVTTIDKIYIGSGTSTTEKSVKYQAIKLKKNNDNEKLTKIKYSLANDGTVKFYLASNAYSSSGGTYELDIRQIASVTNTRGIHTFELSSPVSYSSSSYLIVESSSYGLYVQRNSSSTTAPSGNMLFSENGMIFYDFADYNYSPMIAAYTDIIETTSNDSSNPNASISGGGIQRLNGGEVTLRCSDNVGVTGYYFGKTNPELSNMTTTTDLDKLTSSGLIKNDLSEGIYYLGCRDAKGNTSTDNIRIDSFTARTVLEDFNGNKNVHDNSNFNQAKTEKFYIRDKGTVTLVHRQVKKTGDIFYYYTEDYIPPVESNVFLGYSDSFSSSSTSLDYNYRTISDNNTTYNLWFDRKVLDVTVNSGVGGSTKIETVGQSDNSVTASSNSSKTITIKSGDTIKATATPNSGYSLTSWSGGYLSGNTNPITGGIINENKTITSSFSNQPETHTVTFNSHEGSAVASQTINHGSTATKPSNPTKSGYTFKWWSLTENGTEYNFSTSITSDITLHAVWTSNDIEIKSGVTNVYKNAGKLYVRPLTKPSTTISDLYNNLVSTTGIKMYNASNKELTDASSKIGTGYKLTIGTNTYTLVIFGDVDGTGTVNANDMRAVFSHIKKAFLTGINLEAADYDGNGSINANDMRNMYILIKK